MIPPHRVNSLPNARPRRDANHNAKRETMWANSGLRGQNPLAGSSVFHSPYSNFTGHPPDPFISVIIRCATKPGSPDKKIPDKMPGIFDLRY